MSGAGNDFIIIDSRKNDVKISAQKIAELSNRKNIGCDQFVIIKNSNKADCFMEIYNNDGSISGACGNATRCVAEILCQEKSVNEVLIETAADLLAAKKNIDEISVKMTIPKFGENFYFEELKFFTVDVGNPHAVCFVKENLTNEEFLRIGATVEKHKFFPNKTNVEFAKILNDKEIEVRVFERGVGETLACGTGACAVGAAAIKNKFVKSQEIITKFRGGNLKISWQNENEKILMTGNFQYLQEGFFEI